MCLNNLGSRLRVAGRAIEALDYGRRALEVRPNFGMALCNRVRVLTSYAEALEDPGKRVLFLFVAHKDVSAAVAPMALYTNQDDEAARANTNMLKEKIESMLDLKGISREDCLNFQDDSATDEERNYRRWCLPRRPGFFSVINNYPLFASRSLKAVLRADPSAGRRCHARGGAR